MMNYFTKTLTVLLFSLSLPVNADTKLVYELTAADGSKQLHTYTIDGRWIRVDKGAESNIGFLLLDTGFMIMHVVDQKKESFTTFGKSPIHQRQGLPKKHSAGALHYQSFDNNKRVPSVTAKHNFKPSKQKNRVSGVLCRQINELVENKLQAEHCMADASAFGMTPRELITMSRLIEFSHEMTDPDWIAVQSDERFISAHSSKPESKVSYTLKSVSHDRLPIDHFHIPKNYKIKEPKNDYTGLITGIKKRG